MWLQFGSRHLKRISDKSIFRYAAILTSNNHRSSHSVGGATEGSKVYIHGVDNVLKVEGDLHIEDLHWVLISII